MTVFTEYIDFSHAARSGNGVTAGPTAWMTRRPQGTLSFVQNTERSDEFAVPLAISRTLMYRWLAIAHLPAHGGKNMGLDSNRPGFEFQL